MEFEASHENSKRSKTGSFSKRKTVFKFKTNGTFTGFLVQIVKWAQIALNLLL